MRTNQAKIRLISIITVGLIGLTLVARGATLSTTPAADAFVASGPTGNLADNNYGGGGALGIAAAGLPNGEFQSVLRFDLSGTRSSLDAEFGAGLWSIQSITLQLSSSPHNNAIYNNIAAGQFGISLMQNNSWVEGTGNASSPTTDGITFNTLNSLFINNSVDQALGTFRFPGGTSGANQYTLSLTPGLISDVTAGNELSLRLFAADNTVSYLFSSRSASAALQPELIIDAIPEPRTLALVVMGSVLFICTRGVVTNHRTRTVECAEHTERDKKKAVRLGPPVQVSLNSIKALSGS